MASSNFRSSSSALKSFRCFDIVFTCKCFLSDVNHITNEETIISSSWPCLSRCVIFYYETKISCSLRFVILRCTNDVCPKYFKIRFFSKTFSKEETKIKKIFPWTNVSGTRAYVRVILQQKWKTTILPLL